GYIRRAEMRASHLHILPAPASPQTSRRRAESCIGASDPATAYARTSVPPSPCPSKDRLYRAKPRQAFGDGVLLRRFRSAKPVLDNGPARAPRLCTHVVLS